ncbi:MAG TPA: protein phosphatase 2C domain-containing protein [Pseudacidobacterium sp.]|jgi:protein phosphatase|nr:protein phosphatase 2C domain-containing protein [Pseudacidobacterium sp.]
MEIRIRAAAESHAGRRRVNEDAFGFDLDRGLFAVCDGVGGNRSGEVASRLALDTVLDHFHPGVNGNGGDSSLHRVVQKANHALRKAAESEELYSGMCTTIVSAHLEGNRMWIAHVGDSRAYLLRHGALHRLTEDHSLLAERLRSGLNSDAPELDGILTQALGAGDFVVPEVTSIRVQIGDCFLLATDGLTKPLSNSEILSILIASLSPEHACHQLAEAAVSAGSTDNITCLVIAID